MSTCIQPIARVEEAVLETVALTKMYRMGEVEVHALRGRGPRALRGRVPGPARPLGQRQVHPAQHPRRARRAHGGPGASTAGDDLTAATEAELTRYRRDHVGFVFQFYNLIPSLTARENVALVTEIAPDPFEPEEVLELVGLGDRLDHFPAAALRRRAAAGGDRPGRGQAARRAALRRAHRRARLRDRQAGARRRSSGSTASSARPPRSSPTTPRSRRSPTGWSPWADGRIVREERDRPRGPRWRACDGEARSTASCSATSASCKGQVLTVALVVACGIAGFVAFQSTWRLAGVLARPPTTSATGSPTPSCVSSAPPKSWPARLEAIPGVARVYTRIVQSVDLPIAGPSPAAHRTDREPAGCGQPPLNRLVLEAGRMPEPGRPRRGGPAHRVRPTHGSARRHDCRRSSTASSACSASWGWPARRSSSIPCPPGGSLQSDDERFAVLWMDRAVVAAGVPDGGRVQRRRAFALQPGAVEAAVLRGDRPACSSRTAASRPWGGTASLQLHRDEEMEQLRRLGHRGAAHLPQRLRLPGQRRALPAGRACSGRRSPRSRRLATPTGEIGLHFLKLVTVVVLLGALARDRAGCGARPRAHRPLHRRLPLPALQLPPLLRRGGHRDRGQSGGGGAAARPRPCARWYA